MKEYISIVYLWAEVTGYVHGVLKELSKHATTIDVVHWDRRGVNSTRYDTGVNSGIRFHGRSKTSDEKIIELLIRLNPSIIVVSGWMDKGYIKACRDYKQLNLEVHVVAGIDDQWTGSLRQRLGQIYYKIFYRRLFDFMWVSGNPQYSFAQRFGYGIDSIITNLYSADTTLFNGIASPCKRFVYVGRFIKIKALNLLIESYSKLPEEKQMQWPLILIGDGDQIDTILSKRNQNIKVIPFMQPVELRKELLKGGVACLASHKDQWGVVVHEYALMGLPMLLSTGVGAATEFLISGYNGYIFKKSSVESLYAQLVRFTSMNESELAEFGANSRRLGMRINNEVSAKSLLSVMYAK